MLGEESATFYTKNPTRAGLGLNPGLRVERPANNRVMARHCLFSKVINLCSALNVSHKNPHPYKTTGEITVLYPLVFTFSANGKTKDPGLNSNKTVFFCSSMALLSLSLKPLATDANSVLSTTLSSPSFYTRIPQVLFTIIHPPQSRSSLSFRSPWFGFR